MDRMDEPVPPVCGWDCVRRSAMAVATLWRLPNAVMSISLSRLMSSSRRTSPVISCSAKGWERCQLRARPRVPLHSGAGLTEELVVDVCSESPPLCPLDDLIDPPLERLPRHTRGTHTGRHRRGPPQRALGRTRRSRPTSLSHGRGRRSSGSVLVLVERVGEHLL